MQTDRDKMLESLMLFDRPERERLRNFLPRNADLDALVAALFEPLDTPPRR
jgi:hypothetical protein